MAYGLELQHQPFPGSPACQPALKIMNLLAPKIMLANSLSLLLSLTTHTHTRTTYTLLVLFLWRTLIHLLMPLLVFPIKTTYILISISEFAFEGTQTMSRQVICLTMDFVAIFIISMDHGRGESMLIL